MPAAIPFIIAGSEIATGLGAFGAVSALTAGLSFGAAAFTAAGALTGDKTLSNIGAIAGLGAGVAGLTTSAASTAGEIAKVAPGAADISEAAAVDRAAQTAAGSISDNVAQAANSSEGMIADAAQSTASGATNVAGSAPASSNGVLSSQMGTSPEEAMNGISGPTGPGATQTAQASTMPTSPEEAMAGVKGPTGPGATPDPTSWWDQFKTGVTAAGKWADQNPTLAKVGGGLIQGAFQYEGQQALEDSRMKRQMQYQDWARQRYSDSVRNLTIPTIQTRPNAPPPVQSPVSLSPGLIGGARG